MTTLEMPPVAETSLPNAPAKKVDWGFWVWLGCSLVLVLVVTVVGTAWAVRHTITSGQRFSYEQQETVLAVASFPGTVRDAVKEFMWQFSEDPAPLLLDRASAEKPNWVRHFPEPSDTGYLLFSGVDAKAKQSIVELIRISDGKSMARWVPDWHNILSNTLLAQGRSLPNIKTLRTVHPLLMPNSDIVFSTDYSLIRMSICNNKPIWKIDNLSHHSIEFNSSGNFVVPSKSDRKFPISKWPHLKWEDDSIATISPRGEIIQNDSFANILIKNNLMALLIGIGGVENKSIDLIHINQITPALTDSKYWKRDDLLISSAHLNTLFLYRPSTGKIIWHQTGPWMSQHSVQFIDNHRISVLNNNIVTRQSPDFVNPDDNNTIIVYNFETGKTNEPFKSVLNEAKPRTITQGRGRILPDGGLFIEETNYGRLLRFSKDRLLWSRINDYDLKTIGAVFWSRYLTENEAKDPLRAIEATNCLKNK